MRATTAFVVNYSLGPCPVTAETKCFHGKTLSNTIPEYSLVIQVRGQETPIHDSYLSCVPQWYQINQLHIWICQQTQTRISTLPEKRKIVWTKSSKSYGPWGYENNWFCHEPSSLPEELCITRECKQIIHCLHYYHVSKKLTLKTDSQKLIRIT